MNPHFAASTADSGPFGMTRGLGIPEIRHRLDRLIPAGIYAALLALLYAPAYKVMVAWWQRPDYNYGYVVPLVFAGLVWERRAAWRAIAARPSWMGLVLLVPGILLYWLGELGGEFYALYLSSWLIFTGLCLLHGGRDRLRRLAFPILFLLTMFPPPNFVYHNLSLALKQVSTRLGVTLMQLMGLSVFRDGVRIDLGHIQLQVVDACSGLRYLIPLFVLALLLAGWVRMRVWKRFLIVLAAVPVSILTNGLRIALTGLLAQYWGARVAQGFFHDFSGWFIFMASLGMLLGIIWLLRLYGAEPEPAEANWPPVMPPAAETGWASKQLPCFLAGAGLLLVTLLAAQGIEFRERVPLKRSFESFPLVLNTWQGRPGKLDADILAQLQLSDYALIDYTATSGRTVNFYVAYYETQRKGASIHSPATCLPAGGWTMTGLGMIDLGNDPDGLPRAKGRLVQWQKAGQRLVGIYWFQQSGRCLTRLWQLKISTFWNALSRQRTDGALVRLMTPESPDETVDDARCRLVDLGRRIVPPLNDYLPK